MKRLIYTPNIGYDMSDWKKEPIEKVFAGTDCIMAITSDGRTLQKTVCPERAVRTAYWTRIKQIALSRWASCLAIGLVSDGTCLVSKRALRKRCEDNPMMFNSVSDRVKSWINIKQVAVSDAYFALNNNGHVHVASITPYNRREYAPVRDWENVRRIVTGTQDAVFGITEDGKILCAGENLRYKQERLASFSEVADLYPTGSECESIIIALKDGTILDDRGGIRPICALVDEVETQAVLDGHFNYTVCALNSDRRLVHACREVNTPVFPDNDKPVLSFAVGDCGYGRPFVLAVAEE